MNQRIFIFLLVFISVACSRTVFAQFPVGDCLGAIPVCEPIYQEDESPVGDGNNGNEIGSGNCVQDEKNSVWYIFTVQNTGDFGFILTPNDLNDDYDWALFNLTGKTCADIKNTPSMVASCNAAGGVTCNGVTGCDGSTPYDVQNFGCGESPPVTMGFSPLNAFVPVQAGNTYALLIINWTGSVNGYTLDFSQSSEVGIFDILEPEVADVGLPSECGTSEIPIVFSENVTCVSFQGTSVMIDGPGGPYNATISSLDCGQGGTFTTEYTIIVDPPLTISGNYTLSFDNSPTDLCSNKLIPTDFNFTLNKVPEGTVTALDSVFCGELNYTIDASQTGPTTYLWNDGTTNSSLPVDVSGDYSVYIEGPCFTRTQEYTIIFQGYPTIDDFDTSPDACEINVGTLTGIEATGTNPFAYSIDDSIYQTSANFDSLATGNYILYVQDSFGCETTASVFIDEDISTMDIILDDEKVINLDETVNLDAIINGDFDGFYWTGDSTTLSCIECLDPTASPLLTTIYTLNAFDQLGCEIRESIVVRVVIPREVYIPNIFSPNNDGINENFTISSGRQLTNIEELTIYSRWGEKVFFAEDMIPGDLSMGWNGRFKNRTVNPGVFVYLARLKYIDGFEREVRGTVTVIR